MEIFEVTEVIEVIEVSSGKREVENTVNELTRKQVH
jgi:hypothetical protein